MYLYARRVDAMDNEMAIRSVKHGASVQRRDTRGVKKWANYRPAI